VLTAPGGDCDQRRWGGATTHHVHRQLLTGATALTLAAGAAGNISIGGAAGGGTSLTSVAANGNDITLHNVTTSGGQVYIPALGRLRSRDVYGHDGAMVFGGDATLASAVHRECKRRNQYG